MLTYSTREKSAVFVVYLTCRPRVLDVSETVHEGPLAIRITCITGALCFDLGCSFARKCVLPPPVDGLQRESVRCVSKQRCCDEAECDMERKSVVWSVSVLVELATNHSSKVAKAVDPKD